MTEAERIAAGQFRGGDVVHFACGTPWTISKALAKSLNRRKVLERSND